MTSGEKIAALDNLENLYSSAVSYIDSITHSSLYYTDAECSKFFSSANDGHSSGLIALTLDGMTSQQIIDAGSPTGVIAWWSGSEASIPSGWVLCNGLNSTPDLRNRFIVGAGSHYSRADVGGANTVTSAATITIAGHALTAAETPLHTHGTITDNYPHATASNYGSIGIGYYAARSTSNVDRHTGYTGSGSAHSHTASFAGTSNQDKRPPFYALCAIMKS